MKRKRALFESEADEARADQRRRRLAGGGGAVANPVVLVMAIGAGRSLLFVITVVVLLIAVTVRGGQCARCAISRSPTKTLLLDFLSRHAWEKHKLHLFSATIDTVANTHRWPL